jgi:hypothetical protein
MAPKTHKTFDFEQLTFGSQTTSTRSGGKCVRVGYGPTYSQVEFQLGTMPENTLVCAWGAELANKEDPTSGKIMKLELDEAPGVIWIHKYPWIQVQYLFLGCMCNTIECAILGNPLYAYPQYQLWTCMCNTCDSITYCTVTRTCPDMSGLSRLSRLSRHTVSGHIQEQDVLQYLDISKSKTFQVS